MSAYCTCGHPVVAHNYSHRDCTTPDCTCMAFDESEASKMRRMGAKELPGMGEVYGEGA